MLAILADRHPLRLTKSQLGLLAGFSPRGGTFNGYLGRLIRDGLVAKKGNELEATGAGLNVAAGFGASATVDTGNALEGWMRRLRKGERSMLRALVHAYPVGLDRLTLGEEIGMVYTGGTFNGYLGTLIRNELVEQNGDKMLFANAALLGLAS